MSPVAALNRANQSLSEDLDEVFGEHARLVYRTAYGVTGSPQDAEDVVQNLFLQLLRRGFPAEFRNNPKAYLYRAAVNASLNAVKARQRHVSAIDPARLELAVDTDCSEPDADLQ